MKLNRKAIVICSFILLDCIFGSIIMSKIDNKNFLANNLVGAKPASVHTIEDSLVFVNEGTTNFIEASVVSQEDLQIAQEIILNEQQELLVQQQNGLSSMETQAQKEAKAKALAEQKAKEAAAKAEAERKARLSQDIKDLQASLANEKNYSAMGKSIASYALEFKGQAYVFGGTWNGEMPYTPTDCSGFTQGVYKHFGIDIPRVASDQANVGYEVALKDIQPGDLVFYSSNGGVSVTHAAIYIGNGKIIHAQTPAYGIGVSSIQLGTLVRVHIRRII